MSTSYLDIKILIDTRGDFGEVQRVDAEVSQLGVREHRPRLIANSAIIAIRRGWI